MSPRPFSRVRGGIEMRLSPGETDVVRPLFQQMLELLDADAPDEGLRRLFPPAYEDDPAAEEDFRSLTRGDLTESKKRALRLADATFDKARPKRGSLSVKLDDEEQQAWLSSLNDLRLFLGTRLGVTEESYSGIQPGDAVDPAMQIYLYLGFLEESLLEQLL